MRALIIALCGVLWCGVAFAVPEYNDENCIKAIIGEAIGQSDKELLAHAHALHNRGTLSGVYGIRAFHKHDTDENWQRGSWAWYTSELEPDPTGGATHWLSEYDLTHSKADISWRYKAVSSVKIGKTTFYRLK